MASCSRDRDDSCISRQLSRNRWIKRLRQLTTVGLLPSQPPSCWQSQTVDTRLPVDLRSGRIPEQLISPPLHAHRPPFLLPPLLSLLRTVVGPTACRTIACAASQFSTAGGQRKRKAGCVSAYALKPGVAGDQTYGRTSRWRAGASPRAGRQASHPLTAGGEGEGVHPLALLAELVADHLKGGEAVS